MDELENLFHHEMLGINRKALEDCGYNGKFFLEKVTTLGGLQAAKILLHKPLQNGFTALWKRNRLDLTMEALVIRPPWSNLFSEDELAIASQRLKDHGYSPQ